MILKNGLLTELEKKKVSQKSTIFGGRACFGWVGARQTNIFSSPEPKAQGELKVWDSSQRLSIRASVRPHIKHEYL